MKYTPSVLISSASGKSGGVVAATWKGRGYFRKHVIPANKNTADQQTQRNAFKAALFLWRGLPTAVKTYLDVRGNEAQISGANQFTRTNVGALAAPSTPPVLPVNNSVDAIAGVAYDSEPIAGSAKFIWVDPTVADYDKVFIAVRASDASAWVLVSVATASAAATVTVAGLTVGKTYEFHIGLYNDTTGDIGTMAVVTHLQAS